MTDFASDAADDIIAYIQSEGGVVLYNDAPKLASIIRRHASAAQESKPTTSSDPDEWTYEGNFERLCQQAEAHEKEDAAVRAELTAASKRVRVLEVALTPFAKRGDDYERDNDRCGKYRDDDGLELEGHSRGLRLGDLRHARAALSPTPEAAEGPPTASPEPGWRDDDPCDGAI